MVPSTTDKKQLSMGQWAKNRQSPSVKYGWNYQTQMIHGTGIFTYIYHINEPNVNKYTSTMDHLGGAILPHFSRCPQQLQSATRVPFHHHFLHLGQVSRWEDAKWCQKHHWLHRESQINIWDATFRRFQMLRWYSLIKKNYGDVFLWAKLPSGNLI